MRIELEKRAKVSTLFSILSPFIAFLLTIVFGGIMFALLGKNPVMALYSFFVEPLSEVWSLHELAIKAAPLILIGVGLSVCFRSNNWNIGAEGQFIMGAIAGSILPVVFYDWQSPLVLPLMMLMGMLGGALFAAIPAFLKAHMNTNEILTSLMLVYVAQLFLDWLVRGPWRNPGGMNFPETRTFAVDAILPEMIASGRTHWGFAFAIIAAVLVWFMMRYTLKGFEISVLGQSERAGRFAGFSSRRMIWFSMLLSGALAHDALHAEGLRDFRSRPVGAGRALCGFLVAPHDLVLDAAFRRLGWARRHIRGQRCDPAAAPGHLARLRLHRDHRRLPWSPQSARHCGRRPGARLDLSRR